MFIACDDVKKIMAEKDAQLVDVRTESEFQMNQIPGSINLPLQDIELHGEAKLDKSKPVVVFCRSGGRSQMAMQILISLGFNEVYNMGSYQVWR